MSGPRDPTRRLRDELTLPHDARRTIVSTPRTHVAVLLHRVYCLVVATLLAIFAPPRVAAFEIDYAQLTELTPPPGLKITAANLIRYRQYFDLEFAKLIDQGWVEPTIGPITSYRPHRAYEAATAEYGGRARLGEPGVLIDYFGGRPFPNAPSLSDPRAGEKIAWNMRFLYNGDSGRIPEMFWQYRDLSSGKLLRSLQFEARSLRLMYRHVVEPIPAVRKNLQNAFGAFYMRATDAGDLSDTEVLVFLNRDDNAARRGWVYIPQLRRSQSLESFPPRETLFGSDILPDEFLGYTGRIAETQWRFLGTTYSLLPMYRYDQIAVTEQTAKGSTYRFAHFAGRGQCFPNVTWQLRKTFLVEARPVSADYPVSSRYMYVDAQTFYPAYMRIYDEQGDLWKLAFNGLAHPDSHVAQNRESGAPIVDSATVIDLKNQRCTTVQLLVLTNLGNVRVQDFDPANLGGRGRRR